MNSLIDNNLKRPKQQNTRTAIIKKNNNKLIKELNKQTKYLNKTSKTK